MLRLWRWTFARIYVRSSRKWGKADNPTWAATCAVSLLISANLLSVLLIVGLIFDIDPTLGSKQWGVAAAYVVVVGVVYRQYVAKGGANELIDKVKRESRGQTLREERIRWAYVVGSLALPLVIGAITGYVRRR